MVKRMAGLVTREDGQAIVLFALVLVVLLGFAALAVDTGTISISKSKLQNAADAAALAGAKDLPYTSAAISTATSYAVEKNSAPAVKEVSTGYIGRATHANKVTVVTAGTVEYGFARVLGFSQREVTARAVAKKSSRWTGESLPYINLDDAYDTSSEIVAWEKVSPGDKERIWREDYTISNSGGFYYFTIFPQDGVTITEGKVADIKTEIDAYYNQLPTVVENGKQGKIVYIVSLKPEVIRSGTVWVVRGGERIQVDLTKLKNKDVICPEQLVLLQCLWHDYELDWKYLYLTVLEVYDLSHPIDPPDYTNPDGNGSIKLIE